MSEPDAPRWLSDISDELRQEVPVRSAWRAQLLESIAQSPRPLIDGATAVHERRRLHIVLGPLTALAAAVLFAALGATATFVIQTRRAPHADIAQSSVSPSAGAPTT